MAHSFTSLDLASKDLKTRTACLRPDASISPQGFASYQHDSLEELRSQVSRWTYSNKWEVALLFMSKIIKPHSTFLLHPTG